MITRIAYLFGVAALLCGTQACTSDSDADEQGVSEQDVSVRRGECGGRTGLSCGEDEFCRYAPAHACGAADHLGTCTRRPDACPQVIDPVCGCDHKSYANDCAANAAGVSVLSEGPCPEPAAALPRSCGGRAGTTCGEGYFCDYELVDRCGATDAPGICKWIPEVCTKEIRPVCGCDGRTYDNACFANEAGVAVQRTGACED